MTVYDGVIVDSHQHFWQPELGQNPWLLPDAKVPFRYGSYEALKRSYLPVDYRRDAAGFDIAATVLVETEWLAGDAMGEVQYFESMRDSHDLPTVMVAHAELHDPGVGELLETLASRPIVRGVRHKPGLGPEPSLRERKPSRLTDPAWQRGFALLGDFGLSFDLQCAWWHAADAAALARACPEVQVILDHAGLPVDRSPEGLTAWYDSLRPLAELDSVTVKVSGLGAPGFEWTTQSTREVVERLTELFGPSRLLFGSNFPVDGLLRSFKDIVNDLLEITSGWSESEQRELFYETANRVYRIGLGPMRDRGAVQE